MACSNTWLMHCHIKSRYAWIMEYKTYKMERLLVHVHSILIESVVDLLHSLMEDQSVVLPRELRHPLTPVVLPSLPSQTHQDAARRHPVHWCMINLNSLGCEQPYITQAYI